VSLAQSTFAGEHRDRDRVAIVGECAQFDVRRVKQSDEIVRLSLVVRGYQ
jgi:hypothetical protein